MRNLSPNAVAIGKWQAPTFEGLCPNAINWARMAAYIDGEGSILINPRRHRKDYSTEASGFYLRITVANTDVRLPVWCKENFGGSYKDANTEKWYVDKNYKRAYHWGCASQRAAWILWNCLPYFVMKREQAEIGIQLQESLNVLNRGHELSQEVVEARRLLKKRLLVLKARGKTIMPEQQERIEEVS
jgi:hypothetical protein